MKRVKVPIPGAQAVHIQDTRHEVVDGEIEVSEEIHQYILASPEAFRDWQLVDELEVVEEGIGINVGSLRKRSRPKK